MEYPLGHDKGTEILLKAFRELRQHETGDDIGVAVTEVEDVLPLKHTRIIEDRHVSGNSAQSSLPLGKTSRYVGISTSEQETNTSMYDDMAISQSLKDSTVLKLHSTDVTNITHRADALTLTRGKPSSSLSHSKLTAAIDHEPPTYHLTSLPLEGTLPVISSIETDEAIARDDTVTTIPNTSLRPPSSRTSTICSAVSARSHQEPGPIQISPSAQLQSMQSISKLDARLNEVTRLYRPWSTLRYGRTNNQAAYVPTGTPESITNIPLKADILESHSRLNNSVLSPYTDGAHKHEWAKSSEWVEPCTINDGPKEWIEDFLTRQEQADRDEENERQLQEKQDKQHGSIRYRVNSADKFRRRLSKKRISGERRSFEARHERKNRIGLNIDLGPTPFRQTSDSTPGEDFDGSTRARAFSWTPDTHQSPISLTALPDRSSWTPTSPSPLHRTHAADRPHMSLPSHHPSRRKFSNSSFAPSHHRSTSALKRVATRQQSTAQLRTSSWENLKVKKITSIGSELKRTLSTGFVPAITEGKDSMKGLVGRVEKVGESVTRKLSPSCKDKWKGLGKKKKSMNVGGMHIIGKER
ncbi:hypothetical protein GT037_000467 [Alternaria burnsii]|uniref:Uncharacterized protein n=1 Tax=Alternaria burnsii TaxID=1187904 RepID=A0A8H7BE83_9PLEO|nr:uncharacterized protein GT037_000467 [Alternaria burnsii]KAF7681491.1 hypothetical protein GT037_000467 [Alternaria burnsii]